MMRRWIRATTMLAVLLALPWPAQAIQWGAGTGTSYPTTLDTANNRTNVGGGACSSATTTNICKEWLNDWQAATIAIMTELGTLPKGSYADVKTRLNAGVYSGTAGLSSYVAGDLLYASNTTTLARLAGVATGNVLRAGGVGVAPAWGQVVLTTDVSGILPGANGGTGNGFFAVSGPASSLKTFTLPNVSETIATLGQAETFSALKTFSAGIVSPSLIGGTGTTSTLSLQSTSGVGTTGADIVFKVGNNGATEAGRILNSGAWTLSSALTLPNPIFSVTKTGGGHAELLTLLNDADGQLSLMYFGRAKSSGRSMSVGWADEATTGYAFMSIYGINAQDGLVLRQTGSFGFAGLGGNATPASLLDLRAGDLTMSGANGQTFVIGRATQLVTVGSGLSTKATTIQIPADAIILSVPVYVKTKPGGTSTMTVAATTSATEFQKGASISTNAGTSDPGTKNSLTNYNGTAAQTVTFTFDVPTTDAAGEIRVNIYYMASTPPTS